MSNENKKLSILKLLNSYPSFLANDQTSTATLVASFLEVLSGFNDKIVEAACLAIRKRDSQFAPSSGELFTECERRDIANRKAIEWDNLGRPVVRFSLPAMNRSDFTLVELADWECVVNRVGRLTYVMRVDKAGNALKVPSGYHGAGQEASYGYLTTKEAALGHSVSLERQITAHRVQEMVDGLKNGISEEKSGPRWHKPKNELEAEEMRQAALDALERAHEFARQPLAVSDTLMRQFCGELPIGEGKTGSRPLMTTDEIDAVAHDVL